MPSLVLTASLGTTVVHFHPIDEKNKAPLRLSRFSDWAWILRLLTAHYQYMATQLNALQFLVLRNSQEQGGRSWFWTQVTKMHIMTLHPSSFLPSSPLMQSVHICQTPFVCWSTEVVIFPSWGICCSLGSFSTVDLAQSRLIWSVLTEELSRSGWPVSMSVKGYLDHYLG